MKNEVKLYVGESLGKYGFPNGHPRNRERLLVRRMHPAFQAVTPRRVLRDYELAGMTPEDVT